MAQPFKQPAGESIKETCPQCGRVRETDDALTNRACQCSIRPSGSAPDVSEGRQEESEEVITGDLPAQPDIDLGERYSVLSLIGAGGSARVYKVEDRELKRVFAVKVLDQKLAMDEASRKRFHHEAEASINMTHPNLVAVYGHGMTSGEAPYLVMDCLEGETLAQLLKREKRLTAQRAVNIFTQIADALIHTHLKGIVHRDLKPSNIFISRGADGAETVKVVDFGIARDIIATDCTRLTQTGDIIGSPLYMSPEQCKGESLDARSDIYSLGCVMYEVLSGVSPFAAENPIKTIIKHVGGTVPEFRTVSIDCVVPSALESVVHRCLEKSQNARYQNAEELLADLRSCLENKQVVARPSRIYASVVERYTASVIDGLIVSGLFIFPVSYFVTGSLIPAYILGPSAHWSLPVILQVILTMMVGPFFATVMVLTTNSSTYALAKLIGGPLPVVGCISLLVWLYTALSESSPWQATIGKRLFGIRLVKEDGSRISFFRSSLRLLLGLFTLSLLNAEHFIRMMKNTYLKPFEALKVTIEDSIYLIRNPPTDRWSKTRVVVESAIDNPFLPNLKEHLKVNDLVVRPSAALKAVRNQLCGMTIFVLIILFVQLHGSMQWTGALWILGFFAFFSFPWLLIYLRLTAYKRGRDSARKEEAVKRVSKDAPDS